MQLADLQAKLQSRIENRCGAGPTLDSLEGPLDHARFEYSRYTPKMKTQEFTLPLDEIRVSLRDDLGEPEQVIYIEGVYVHDDVPSTPLGQGYGSSIDGGTVGAVRELPSVYHMRSRYREKYQREVQFYRNFHEMVIVRPTTMERVVGIVVFGVVQDWADLPVFEEKYLLDRAVAEFIDQNLVSESGGLVRIPSPNGSYEFDGGRVLLSLRDKLIDGFEDHLGVRTSGIFSG